MARVTTRIRWDPKAIRELRTDPKVMHETFRAARGLADDIAALAPKDTGAGAESIRARPSRAVGAADVGWDADHFYLIFTEFGTKYIDAQRFARDALDRYTYL